MGWWRRTRGVALAVMMGVAAGCTAAHAPSSPRGAGIYHEVTSGENLYRIGKAYGVSHNELARVNGIHDPNRLEIGQRIFVPGGKRTLPVSLITPKNAISAAPEEPIDESDGNAVFIWPIANGTLSSSFGPRGQSFHDGIDIAAPPGTRVSAAREGVVIYSDTLRGYGNVVIVEHGGGYATVYAHNDENLVRTGDRVRQGDPIARVGNSGRTSGPNLHFEVRKNNIARNPIYFLPSQLAQRAKDKPT